ncbi:hypothetical protein BMH32_08990 [Leucobacter sp. OLJS4]|uniref:PepSY domain-containing protein n=1 Tax=unclassified Leucobacter TaxID=2621730 RepID=UPI000C1943E8|nr:MULTISPECIES: PepSY domain-containing protein [unclassified Leucobacter]PIJ45887.1 hypothetical protein BMH30_07425 [Leucobacter sp. OLES1]PII85080.1 hypothetical protein BMH25_02905 [Leucobacter sp. OLCALW19]PII89091.1 hypothetical protein BMH26_04510 [Leucobacter sp. OLTLW20]PII93503.1 hypothetical protein BMH27_03095 [Leucobacter sp. OLAS13]PII98102.1 hypothetical protein BMH29_09655 [Leucobacter sp. OLDS2]
MQRPLTLASATVALLLGSTLVGCSAPGSDAGSPSPSPTSTASESPSNASPGASIDLADEQPAVSLADALATAQKRVPGDLLSAELDTERGELRYQFEIRTADREHEIEISATTGEFVRSDSKALDREAKAEAKIVIADLIDPAEAMARAVQEVPGAARSWNLEHSDNALRFQVEVATDQGEREVDIDARSGAVLGVDR